MSWSNTAVKSFHGITISLFQHTGKDLAAKKFYVDVLSENAGAKLELPAYYMLVAPSRDGLVECSLQSINVREIEKIKDFSESNNWLLSLEAAIQKKLSFGMDSRVSWTAFY